MADNTDDASKQHNTNVLDRHSEEDELLTPEEAGVYIGGSKKPVPVTTLQWWRTTKRGPKYYKPPGTRYVRYRKSALDAFLAAGSYAGGTDRVRAGNG